jgi:hypothetical protein
MSALRLVAVLASLILLTAAVPTHLPAQATRADSAAILLEAARQLDAQGEVGLARDILAILLRHYGDTPASQDAATWWARIRGETERDGGQVGLTVWNTLFGAWLGVAVPAAVGANEPAPYGAGLLLGAPLGFGVTKALTNRYPVTSGQAIATSFGSIWGTFQSVGWRSVLDIGEAEQCYYDPYSNSQHCWHSTPDEAPWTAAVIGGVVGIAGGAVISGATDPSAGTATMIQFGAFWGTWFGLAAGVLADAEDDALLAWTLSGGNAGLLGTALSSGAWDVTQGQAWLITAAGLAGGIGGLGLDLLFEVKEAKTAVAIPAVTSAAGLLASTVLTRSRHSNGGDDGRFGTVGSLVNVSGSEWSLGLPIPQPTIFNRADAARSHQTVLGVRVPLLTGNF